MFLKALSLHRHHPLSSNEALPTCHVQLTSYTFLDASEGNYFAFQDSIELFHLHLHSISLCLQIVYFTLAVCPS